MKTTNNVAYLFDFELNKAIFKSFFAKKKLSQKME